MTAELKVGDTVDRYEIVRQLGAGGMASVYAIRHTELGSEHALKVLLVDSPRLRKRLLKEGRLQASLRHPHIVAVHDVIEVQGQPALVMELVDGLPLDEWIEVNPDADDAVRRLIATQILAGVGHAHEQGMVHRDLKPANVMITEVAGEPFPKVADFGLAKLFEADDMSQTKTGVPMGTPRYMAPEQITDAKNVDHRADIFALGCMLHELWTGRAAFEAGSIPELFMDIQAGSLPDLTGIPDDVASAIRGALAPERDDRLQSCQEMLEAIRGERVVPVARAKRRGGCWLLAGGLGLTLTMAAGVTVLGALAILGVVLATSGGSKGDRRSDPEPAPITRPDPEPPSRTPVRPSPSPTPSPSPSPVPRPSPEPDPKPGKDKDKDKGKGKGKGH